MSNKPVGYTCPTCTAPHMNEPNPLEQCGTCGEPVCDKCAATCELCGGALHQQIPQLGNQQCMFAFEDRDPDTGGSSCLLVCGRCYEPGELAAALDRRDNDLMAQMERAWAAARRALGQMQDRRDAPDEWKEAS